MFQPIKFVSCALRSFVRSLTYLAPLLGVACSALPAAAQPAATLFQDEFNGTALDGAKWGVFNNVWTLHRTRFGNWPEMASENGTGFTRLRLDTHNPDPGLAGSYFK